jgi:CRP/FNR family transcriptional regulator, cyclic AMP receptor protein
VSDEGSPHDSGGTNQEFDYHAFIAKHGGATISDYKNGDVVYTQGDPSDALFYVISGTVTLTTVSDLGKEAVIAFLGPGHFFGEGSLDGGLLRRLTIKCTASAKIVRLERGTVMRALQEDLAFASLFLSFVLHRNHALQANLIDQLFNSSEKRLARILLTLASAGLDTEAKMITIPITQEMLANMVGTTRSRINQFMMKFRKLGYIDYNGQIQVRSSLLSVFLNDSPHND